mgnify:CR=1
DSYTRPKLYTVSESGTLAEKTSQNGTIYNLQAGPKQDATRIVRFAIRVDAVSRHDEYNTIGLKDDRHGHLRVQGGISVRLDNGQIYV